MKTSPAGLNLIKKHEGLRLRAYLCPANVPTIGYGHTGTVTFDDVRARKSITEEGAGHLLRLDLRHAEDAVNTMVKVPLCQHEFDALVSFVFNIGAWAFGKSTLLRLLNKGFKYAVPGQLARWNRGGGRVLAGLVARRADEASLWAARVGDTATADNVDSTGAKMRRLVGLA
ncbi:MAG: lysozyme [Mycobacterium sp.]